MEEPLLPEPDDVMQQVLGLVFGPGSFLLLLYVIVHFLVSWYAAARSGARLLQRLRRESPNNRPRKLIMDPSMHRAAIEF